MQEKNVPELRFAGFEGDWEKKKLGDVVKINQGLQIAISERLTEKVDGAHFYITNEFLRENSEKKYFIKDPPKSVLCTKEDVLMTRTGNTGMVVTNVEGAFHNNFFKIAYPDYLNKNFLVHFLILPDTQNQILKLAGASTIPDLNHSDFYRIKIPLPSHPEQQKIATFFTAIDEKLVGLRKRKGLLEDWKKGVMQRIFLRELQFSDEGGKEFGEWEEKLLGEIAERRTARNAKNDVKNVFTNSATYGIINQRDFFDKDIANQDNLLNYFIVEHNDFVYNPRISNQAPVGPIGRNHLQTGVMSPLYSVFRFKSGSLDFFEGYFKTTLWHEYMESIANYGARHDRMSISVKDFYQMPLPFPTIEEQTKIANFLSAIDEKIAQCSRQIEKAEAWKKGLMQRMFV